MREKRAEDNEDKSDNDENEEKTEWKLANVSDKNSRGAGALAPQ